MKPGGRSLGASPTPGGQAAGVRASPTPGTKQTARKGIQDGCRGDPCALGLPDLGRGLALCPGGDGAPLPPRLRAHGGEAVAPVGTSCLPGPSHQLGRTGVRRCTVSSFIGRGLWPTLPTRSVPWGDMVASTPARVLCTREKPCKEALTPEARRAGWPAPGNGGCASSQDGPRAMRFPEDGLQDTQWTEVLLLSSHAPHTPLLESQVRKRGSRGSGEGV